MLNPYVSCIVYAFEMVITYIFLSRISEKKHSSVKCLLIGFLLFEIASLINLIGKNNILVNAVVAITVKAVFMYLFFQIRLLPCICYSITLEVLNFALELITIFSLSFFTKSNSTQVYNNLAFLLISCFTSKNLYFITCLILSGRISTRANSAGMPLRLFFYPISVTICLGIFWYICTLDEIGYTIQLLLSIASLIIFGSALLLFLTYQEQIDQNTEYINLKREYDRLTIEKSYYDILAQQNEDLMIYVHDAKKHLATIESLNCGSDISTYVKALSDQLNRYSQNCHSGNKLLDVMINKYDSNCKSCGISFSYDFRQYNFRNVADIDLVAILGNLMDNAITAASVSAKKEISLETNYRNAYGVLIISNSCDSAPIVKGDQLLSSKDTPQIHGYGLKSVSKTLKKYQGDMMWEFDDAKHIFTMTVMIATLSDSLETKNSTEI